MFDESRLKTAGHHFNNPFRICVSSKKVSGPHTGGTGTGALAHWKNIQTFPWPVLKLVGFNCVNFWHLTFHPTATAHCTTLDSMMNERIQIGDAIEPRNFFFCFFLFFSGGKIVSSKPFAPLNFRINSRNLSGEYLTWCKKWFDVWNVWCLTCTVFLCFSLCRYWHNNACGGAFSSQGLSVMDRKASFLLPAYHRPHHSKHSSTE